MNRRIQRAVGKLQNIILAVLVLMLLSLLLMRLAGVRPYVVMSGSMEPEIKTGSLCFVNTRAAYEDVREGDIIAFLNGVGMPVTHRAVRITEVGIETRGDNNDVTDGITTTEENYLGETVLSLPWAGYVCWIISGKVGKIGIALLVCLLCVTAVISLKRENPI